MTEEKAPSDTPPAAPAPTAPSGDAPAPGPGAPAAPEGTDKQLVALCVILWLVACAIAWSSFGETRVNYYLGNLKQTLDREKRLDDEAISRLAAMGDPIVPTLDRELATHTDPLFRIALLKVLERIPGKVSFKVLTDTLRQDLDARVRANAIVVVATRGQKAGGEERTQAVALAIDALAGERDPSARAIAAKSLADLKDPLGLPPLVEGLKAKEELVRKICHEAAKTFEPQGPAFDPSAGDDVRTRQAWEWENHLRKKDGKPLLPPPVIKPPPAAVDTTTPPGGNNK